MPIAYPTTKNPARILLAKEELISLFYHDIFEYPLGMGELVKWSVGRKALANNYSTEVSAGSGLFYLRGREGIVLKRLMRKRISTRKLAIAKEAAKVFSLIPTVKLLGVTGALSMDNASDESDIDLLVVTKKSTLWMTRFLAYFLLKVFHFALRKPKDKVQKDKLCLNMWMDESDLLWEGDGRNIYAAHEIAQVKPLINKGGTYELFVAKNNWIQDYWPNAVRVIKPTKESKKKDIPSIFKFFEKIAFNMQYFYMRRKITREVVTPTRALFHPVDWSEFVLQKLST